MNILSTPPPPSNGIMSHVISINIYQNGGSAVKASDCNSESPGFEFPLSHPCDITCIQFTHILLCTGV